MNTNIVDARQEYVKELSQQLTALLPFPVAVRIDKSPPFRDSFEDIKRHLTDAELASADQLSNLKKQFDKTSFVVLLEPKDEYYEALFAQEESVRELPKQFNDLRSKNISLLIQEMNKMDLELNGFRRIRPSSLSMAGRAFLSMTVFAVVNS